MFQGDITLQIWQTAGRLRNTRAKRYAAIAFVFVCSVWPQWLAAQFSSTDLFKPSSTDEFLGLKTIRLWDGPVPDALGDGVSDIPTLTIFQPQPHAENGTALIVAPGGAYLGLASNLEGRQVADWLAAHGITAFILRYRLGPKYIYPVPLWDAQRAIRLVRAHASEYGILPNRIGIMGFSAGGHLAAAAGTLADLAKTTESDPVDRISSRPDFMVLAYPWLNAMQPNQQGLITYCSVIRKLSAEDCKQFESAYTPALHVTAQTPPAFLYGTSDDEAVSVSASVAFYQALQVAGVPAEIHIFAHGAHGSGLGDSNPALSLWPGLLESWFRGRGLLTQEAPSK